MNEPAPEPKKEEKPLAVDMPDDVLTKPKEESKAPDPKPKEEHTPPEDGKRWNEMYARGKKAEREVDTLKKQNEEINSNFDDLKEHNKKLARSLEDIHDTVLNDNAPNPNEDPDGFLAHATKKAELAAERKFQQKLDEEKERQAQAKAAEEAAEEAKKKENVDTNDDVTLLKAQISTMEVEHDDYNQVVTKELQEEIKNNTDAYNRVWSSKNPPAEAYKYAQEKVAEAKRLAEQGYVEPGGRTGAPSKGEIKLNTAQKKMAHNLGVSEKKYAAQLEHINAKRKGK